MRLLAIPLLFLLPVGVVLAQGDIHRCISADGTPMFTDRVCSDVNARPVTPPPTASSSTEPPATALHAPPAVLCAANLSELKQAVVDAFAAHDPNRLAGLMLWGGYGDDAVVADIRGLGQLMQRPLLAIDTAMSQPQPRMSWWCIPVQMMATVRSMKPTLRSPTVPAACGCVSWIEA